MSTSHIVIFIAGVAAGMMVSICIAWLTWRKARAPKPSLLSDFYGM